MPYEDYSLGTSNTEGIITTTSREIMKATAGTLRRTQFIITNTSETAVITIAKGINPAVSKAGIILYPSGSYVEADDAGFNCYQGSIQAVGTGTGTLAIVETYEVRI